jgi:hypothetical protein
MTAAPIGVGLISVGWMGKLHEAKKFLVAVTGGERRNSTAADAQSVAEVISATAASADGGGWRTVPRVRGATFGGRAPVHAEHVHV